MYHEGGYVNHPDDPGGETKYGISKRTYPYLDIKHLTMDQARQIYFVDFWLKAKCEQIENEPMAEKFFDACVNTGIGQAVTLLQRALRATGAKVEEDGVIGPVTLEAVNKADNAALVAAFRSEAAGYYRLLAGLKPTQRLFLSGWLTRAYN
jgi:lysozyme family protein